ncbi:MAG: ferritin family protein [Candidatus Diapherotrites archaeon]
MKSRDLEKAVALVSSKNKAKIAEGLEVAEKIEKDGIEFYSRQAEKAQSAELRDFFNFLAGQEKEHLESILSVNTSLLEKGKWPAKPLSKFTFRQFSKKDWDKGMDSAVNAMLFALWKEKEASEFYSGAAEKISDKNGKKFFLALSEFEKGHADMLSEFVEDSFYSHELIMG